MDDRKLVKRSDKVSFLGCLTDDEETFNRMRGFTTLSGKTPRSTLAWDSRSNPQLTI